LVTSAFHFNIDIIDDFHCLSLAIDISRLSAVITFANIEYDVIFFDIYDSSNNFFIRLAGIFYRHWIATGFRHAAGTTDVSFSSILSLYCRQAFIIAFSARSFLHTHYLRRHFTLLHRLAGLIDVIDTLFLITPFFDIIDWLAASLSILRWCFSPLLSHFAAIIDWRIFLMYYALLITSSLRHCHWILILITISHYADADYAIFEFLRIILRQLFDTPTISADWHFSQLYLLKLSKASLLFSLADIISLFSLPLYFQLLFASPHLLSISWYISSILFLVILILAIIGIILFSPSRH